MNSEKQPREAGAVMDIRRPAVQEFGVYCIQLEFGLGVFRRRYTAEVHSRYNNHRGLDLIQMAVEHVFGQLSADDGDSDTACIVLQDSEGAQLEVCDDLSQYENWLGNLLISGAIIGVEYKPWRDVDLDEDLDISITEDSGNGESS